MYPDQFDLDYDALPEGRNAGAPVYCPVMPLELNARFNARPESTRPARQDLPDGVFPFRITSG